MKVKGSPACKGERGSSGWESGSQSFPVWVAAERSLWRELETGQGGPVEMGRGWRGEVPFSGPEPHRNKRSASLRDSGFGVQGRQRVGEGSMGSDVKLFSIVILVSPLVSSTSLSKRHHFSASETAHALVEVIFYWRGTVGMKHNNIGKTPSAGASIKSMPN